MSQILIKQVSPITSYIKAKLVIPIFLAPPRRSINIAYMYSGDGVRCEDIEGTQNTSTENMRASVGNAHVQNYRYANME